MIQYDSLVWEKRCDSLGLKEKNYDFSFSIKSSLNSKLKELSRDNIYLYFTRDERYIAVWNSIRRNVWLVDHRNFMIHKKIATGGGRNQDIEKLAGDLPLHMPPVQFATLMSLPWQARPPWLGGGSSQSLLLVCVQSLPHTDHADHLDHCPSTTGKESKIEAFRFVQCR